MGRSSLASRKVGESGRYARLLAGGRLRLHYQPIVNLRSGAVTGVEALARLEQDGLIPPGVFLPELGVTGLRELLFRSLGQGLSVLEDCAPTHPGLNLSLNVDPVVLQSPDFCAVLTAQLGRAGVDPRRITLEILEVGEFLCQDAARRTVERLRAAGFVIALDDVGSAYSSLLRLRDLPVDIVKLDQAFVRGLHREPENLQFVFSMMSLSRGLRRQMVVEGVETDEILDAMCVIGVESAQGYAIARPMPAEALVDWLHAHRPAPASRQPRTLLGAFGSHLCLMEACRALLNQPLQSAWLPTAADPHACLIGRFFNQQGLHDTAVGSAHKRFHATLPTYDTEREAWEEAAAAFRAALKAAMRDEGVLPLSPSARTPEACACGG